MDPVKKQTLLCVDDDKTNLELLEAVLSPMGYGLQFSESGADALKQIAQGAPDLILLDIMMPAMSGLEVLARLRADEKTRSIPVVLLTALHAPEDKARGLKAGCDDFISKPFDESELTARIRSLLRIGDYQRSLNEKGKWEYAIQEMGQALIVCGPDWGVLNFNRAAQRYLKPGMEPGSFNLLDYVFGEYAVSVPWTELNDCTTAPKKFEIEKKNTDPRLTLRAEVTLEVLENPAHEVVNIVLTVKDAAQANEKEKKAKGFWSFLSFGNKREV